MLDEPHKVSREPKSVALTVYNPTGAIKKTQSHAPRLTELGGKTICELSNGRWEDLRVFALIRELLGKRFPDAKIIPLTEFPVGAEQIVKERTIDLIVEKGCQGLIIGNAA